MPSEVAKAGGVPELDGVGVPCGTNGVPVVIGIIPVEAITPVEATLVVPFVVLTDPEGVVIALPPVAVLDPAVTPLVDPPEVVLEVPLPPGIALVVGAEAELEFEPPHPTVIKLPIKRLVAQASWVLPCIFIYPPIASVVESDGRIFTMEEFFLDRNALTLTVAERKHWRKCFSNFTNKIYLI